MTSTTSHTPTQSLDDLLAQFVGDLGATMAAGNDVIGDRLGLHRALAEAGPLTSADLATYTGTSERYVREWLRGQAGEGAVCRVVEQAGFGHVARVAETPFNIVYEARA
jgi:hypothetical protein